MLTGFYLSTDPEISEDDTFLSSRNNGNLKPNETRKIPSRTLRIPSSTLPGEYYVGIMVDRTDVVSESNEFNNDRWSQVITVGSPPSTSTPPPPEDMTPPEDMIPPDAPERDIAQGGFTSARIAPIEITREDRTLDRIRYRVTSHENVSITRQIIGGGRMLRVTALVSYTGASGRPGERRYQWSFPNDGEDHLPTIQFSPDNSIVAISNVTRDGRPTLTKVVSFFDVVAGADIVPNLEVGLTDTFHIADDNTLEVRGSVNHRWRFDGTRWVRR